MNDPTNPTSVTLGREPAFHLGALEIRPATREVVGAGWRDVLEPRVMQVLVVLARAGGEVVARDDLMTACWEGRVVGDDALNRAIARIRRIAERPDSGFALDTIRKVGYRLAPIDYGAIAVAAESAATPAHDDMTTPATPDESAAVPRSRFRLRWGWFAAAAATLVLGVWVAFAAGSPAQDAYAGLAGQAGNRNLVIAGLRTGAGSQATDARIALAADTVGEMAPQPPLAGAVRPEGAGPSTAPMSFLPPD
jgi:DNA-binding winged helix-turn-helix (wHTH) protein